MRKLHKYGSTFLTALLLSAPAMADSNSMTPSPAAQQAAGFSSFDKNSNNLIDIIELRQNFVGHIPDDVFASYDTSNDGALDRGEFNKFMQKNYKVNVSNKKELMETQLKNKVKQQQVAEINAKIAKQNEAAKEKAASVNGAPKVKLTMDFVVFDKNNDKQIDIQEFNSRTNSVINADRVYGFYDSNKDNLLNIEEFKRYVNSDPKIPVEVSNSDY